jgi:hypothetical protein
LVESLGRGRWPGVFALFFLGKVWRDQLTGCQKHRNS